MAKFKKGDIIRIKDSFRKKCLNNFSWRNFIVLEYRTKRKLICIEDNGDPRAAQILNMEESAFELVKEKENEKE